MAQHDQGVDVPASSTEDRPHYHSHALSRGLRLVKIITETDVPVTLAAFHELTGLPKSTLVRLLSVLEAENYVVRVDERPAFVLGHGVLPIITGYLASGGLTQVIRPYARQLARHVGWTANFGVMEPSGTVYHLCVEYPDRPLRFMASEGGVEEAYSCGLGKALLAELDESELSSYLPAEPFTELTDRTLTTKAALQADLEKVRAQGYAVDDEESALGLRCVAVAVRSEEDVFGALSVSGPAGELPPGQEAELVAQLRAVADELVSDPQLRSAMTLLAKREGHHVSR